MNREQILGRINPLLETLPSWFEKYRPIQIEAINKILGWYEAVPLVVLEAPPGTGKTLMAETVRRMLKVQALYTCHSKGLQDQFARDYEYAKVIKGRANYLPEFGYEGVTCEDCTAVGEGDACQWCSNKLSCPYEVAKQEGMAADIAVLNTAYYLAEANFAGRLAKLDRLIVFDEADKLEDALMSYVSVEITPRRMERYGWTGPDKVTKPDSWQEWIEGILPQIKGIRGEIPFDRSNLGALRERRYLTNLQQKLQTVSNGLDKGYWVYTGRRGEVSFKPSRVDSLGESYLWRHGKQWLMMSGTIISAEQRLDDLGYRGEYGTVRVGSPFDKGNRPVYVKGVANCSRAQLEAGWDKLVAGVREVVESKPGERVLVHTVSYDLAGKLSLALEDMGRAAFVYQNSQDRQSVLDYWLASDDGVLYAPSMDRGVDLADDACRVQVIAKVPFPNLGDRQISQRLHSKGGQSWYRVQTIATIIQMTGRVVRNEDDYGETWVLDKQFRKVWNESRLLFPKWWTEGLKWA